MPTLFDYGIKKSVCHKEDSVSLSEDDLLNPQTRPKNSSLTQTSIDLGQKGLGPSCCPICGMIFRKGVASDDKDHHLTCRKRTHLGKKVDILRKITLFSPRSLDEIMVENFDFGMLRSISDATDLVRKLLRILDSVKSSSGYSLESGVQRTQYLTSREHQIGLCMGSASSLELLGSKKNIATYELYGVSIVKRVREGHVLASVEEMWINPACLDVTLQKDIYQGMMEMLKTQLIYGYRMQNFEISLQGGRMSC